MIFLFYFTVAVTAVKLHFSRTDFRKFLIFSTFAGVLIFDLFIRLILLFSPL